MLHLRNSKKATIGRSVKANCKYIFNNKTETIELDEETILLENARKIHLKQNCDIRNLSLSGNYLISLNNCSITYNNQTFKNKKTDKRKIFFTTNTNY